MMPATLRSNVEGRADLEYCAGFHSVEGGWKIVLSLMPTEKTVYY